MSSFEPDRAIYVPPEGPPMGGGPNPEIYQKMGEENICNMIKDFYRELENSKIRHLFPENMIEASQKSALYFIFLLGGPPLYQEKHGPPMMRRRHLPFKIDEEARQVWLNCFKVALDKAVINYRFPLEHKHQFWEFLTRFSGWMINAKS